MDENFTWGGHIPIVLILLMISAPWIGENLNRAVFMTAQNGGLIIILIVAVFLITFTVPIMSLQVLHLLFWLVYP